MKKFEGLSKWRLHMRVSGVRPAERQMGCCIVLVSLGPAPMPRQPQAAGLIGMMLEAGDVTKQRMTKCASRDDAPPRILIFNMSEAQLLQAL